MTTQNSEENSLTEIETKKVFTNDLKTNETSETIESNNTKEEFTQNSQQNGEKKQENGPTETDYEEQQRYAQMMLSAQQTQESSSEPISDLDRPTYNIFVGDLRMDAPIEDEDLIQVFGECGEIVGINIFRDPHTKQHRGFGFVHFAKKESQQKALSPEFSSNLMIKGKVCKVCPSEQKNTLFVGNLPLEMTKSEVEKSISDLIGPGLIVNLELKTGPPPNFGSRGFCFVQFTTHTRADQARKILIQSTIKGKPLNVAWADNRATEDLDEDVMSKVKTLYVSNISITVTEQVLVSLFSEYGIVRNCVIVKNQDRMSRGFAFVEFEEREQAMKALEKVNGTILVGQQLSVVLAKPPPIQKVIRGGSVVRGGALNLSMRGGFIPRGGFQPGMQVPLPVGGMARGQRTIGKFPRTTVVPYAPPGIQRGNPLQSNLRFQPYARQTYQQSPTEVPPIPTGPPGTTTYSPTQTYQSYSQTSSYPQPTQSYQSSYQYPSQTEQSTYSQTYQQAYYQQEQPYQQSYQQNYQQGYQQSYQQGYSQTYQQNYQQPQKYQAAYQARQQYQTYGLGSTVTAAQNNQQPPSDQYHQYYSSYK